MNSGSLWLFSTYTMVYFKDIYNTTEAMSISEMTTHKNYLNLTLTLLTIDWASGTGGCREYSDRRGSKDETNVDLSCCAS